MKHILILLTLILSACSNIKQSTESEGYSTLLNGKWQRCGSTIYQGKRTGSGNMYIYNDDATYTATLFNVFDDIKCSNKIDSAGGIIKGTYKIVGPSDLGKDIYNVNISNRSGTGKTCYTIIRIRQNSILSGKSSGRNNCSSESKRHKILENEKFSKFRK